MFPGINSLLIINEQTEIDSEANKNYCDAS